MSSDRELFFSYGTLQDPAVQEGTFGRRLAGHPDRLVGHAVRMLAIADADVVQLSGAATHPIVVPTGDPSDEVGGTVFEITRAELEAADAYEVDDYERVAVDLASGATAWVYLARRQ